MHSCRSNYGVSNDVYQEVGEQCQEDTKHFYDTMEANAAEAAAQWFQMAKTRPK